jgi:hypothetical protein
VDDNQAEAHNEKRREERGGRSVTRPHTFKNSSLTHASLVTEFITHECAYGQRATPPPPPIYYS